MWGIWYTPGTPNFRPKGHLFWADLMESKNCRLFGMWCPSHVLLWLCRPRNRWMNEEQGIVLCIAGLLRMYVHWWRICDIVCTQVRHEGTQLSGQGSLRRAVIFLFCVSLKWVLLYPLFFLGLLYSLRVRVSTGKGLMSCQLISSHTWMGCH